MGTPEKPVQLKVFVDKKKKKVMFAEAAQDFVDILFSFFTLPLGTIARLSTKHGDSKDIKVGSLTSLYESVFSLNENHFYKKHFYNNHYYFPPLCQKDLLVNLRNSSASKCEKLKVNLDGTKSNTTSVTDCEGSAVFVKNLANFIIADDLNVRPVVLDTSIGLFKSLGVENINSLEEKTMYFGLEEFLSLLKWSLLTINPLTNMVFGGGKPCSPSTTSSTLSNSALIGSNSGQTSETLKLKLLVQKSNKKLLCAQVENLFVEMLFSFLTIPLGTVIRLTKDGSSPSGITNLYNSISCLGDGKFLKSDDVKNILLSPKLATDYFRATDFLPIYEAHMDPCRFLNEQTTFMVSDDLEVIASPSIATFSNFNTLGVPVGDMEVVEVNFGEHEAILLLKASLTSTSALTDFLNASKKKPKVESST